MTAIDAEHTAQRTLDDDGAIEGGSPRRRGRRLWLALGAVVVVIVAGAALGLWVAGSSTESVADVSGPAATTVVEVGTIAATESWDGTLGHGAPFTVTSSGEGMITWIADQGVTVGRGAELYRVDEQPVILMMGPVPMYRGLELGDSGADVEQLQTNLADLGYDGVTVDGTYGAATADAVDAWQRDIGVEPTGTVSRRDVVFAPEGGQVDALRAQVGGVVGPGTPVLDITGTDQIVSLEAALADRDRFVVDTAVTIVLPDDQEIAGTVSATSVVELRAEGPEGANDTEPILEVEIAVDGNAPDELVGLSVEVIVAIDERTDVLLVPVGALVALAEGGYGLEVVTADGTTSTVRIEAGLFADGKVEIRSDDVTEGMVVGVAGR